MYGTIHKIALVFVMILNNWLHCSKIETDILGLDSGFIISETKETYSTEIGPLAQNDQAVHNAKLNSPSLPTHDLHISMCSSESF